MWGGKVDGEWNEAWASGRFAGRRRASEALQGMDGGYTRRPGVVNQRPRSAAGTSVRIRPKSGSKPLETRSPAWEMEGLPGGRGRGFQEGLGLTFT